jgi:hypothetical protein
VCRAEEAGTFWNLRVTGRDFVIRPASLQLRNCNDVLLRTYSAVHSFDFVSVCFAIARQAIVV